MIIGGAALLLAFEWRGLRRNGEISQTDGGHMRQNVAKIVGFSLLSVIGLVIVVVAAMQVHQFIFGEKKGEPERVNPAIVNESMAQESVYNRVIKNGSIRCAYVVYPPSVIKDPKTGKLSGISIETIEEAAKRLNLNIEWQGELTFGTMVEALEADRFDLVVSGIWPNASRAKKVDFSTPLFYSGIGIYVRENDHRFDGNRRAINNEKVRISTVDGEMSDIIADTQYRRAQRVVLPKETDVSKTLLAVSQGKADIAFVEPYVAYNYDEANKDNFNKEASNLVKLKNLTPDKPIRIFGNTVLLRRGQTEFKTMLNVALEELINSGFIELKMVGKGYEPKLGIFYRSAYPYRTESAKE